MAEKKEIRLITCGGNVLHYQTFDTSQLLTARLLFSLVLYSDYAIIVSQSYGEEDL